MEAVPAVGVAKNRSSVIKWALVIGIAIVINLFLTYLVRVVYHEPLFEDFCLEKQVNEVIETKEACIEIGGQWNENNVKSMPVVQRGDVFEPNGYCNTTFTCQKQFDDVNKVYNRNVFIVFVIAGIILLGGSVFLAGAEAVSLGLSFGGVLALIIGSTTYWSDMEDILRVVILGFALIALIFVAWKKFRDEETI